MIKICGVCSTQFTTRSSKRKFCSLGCGYAGRKTLSGPDNPMYGKIGILNPAFKTGKWAGIKPARNLRKKICEDCGSINGRKGRGLEAHHLDRNHMNNSPENIVTVCGKCHMKRHWKNDGTIEGQVYPDRRKPSLT